MLEIPHSPALKEAFKITWVLDKLLGEERFDKKFKIEDIALEYSKKIAPESPIHFVSEKDIPGCMGALIYSENRPRQWGILYHYNQSIERQNFTIAHEFGHYILHRNLIDDENNHMRGIYCTEDNIIRGNGSILEREADEFAANLLMPLNDFRNQIHPKAKPNFNDLGKIANRYGVSLTAATLRWLGYTENRALLVVSNEGFAHWSRSSKPAFKSGCYIRTSNTVYELPKAAIAASGNYCDETENGIEQQAGVWFSEPVVEMCIRSDRYDLEMTLLYLPRKTHEYEDEDVKELILKENL